MEHVKEESSINGSINQFPVVGIGASAGGLDAFKSFIKAIPDNCGMAFILVQHLHADHASSLPEILQRETSIPVQEISDRVTVQPNTIYVIPSNKMLVASDGILELSPRPEKGQPNNVIDVFFSSLAEVHQSRSIGIILSGTGSDGTAGLKQIKDQGGITFAQEVAGAEFGAMPQSAIDQDVADFVANPEKMPEQLMRLNQALHVPVIAGTESSVNSSEEESFKQILTVLRTRKGMDFTYYKQTTIRRRILRRLALINKESVKEYMEFLHQNNPEQDILFQDMLIPVTTFFRDTKS
ncbi:MAG: histidine kinase, partial [Chitinophagaceae bacterium]|nr:histidine kinase [Chitinophagaceae bacterium]